MDLSFIILFPEAKEANYSQNPGNRMIPFLNFIRVWQRLVTACMARITTGKGPIRTLPRVVEFFEEGVMNCPYMQRNLGLLTSPYGSLRLLKGGTF